MSDLGDPWFSDLPKDWSVQPFKRMASVRNGQVDPRDERFCDLPLYAPNHIESGTGRLLGVETAADQGADSGKYPVRADEVVYSKIRPALRKVIIAPEDGLCSADMYAIAPGHGVSGKFLYWAMLSEGFSAAAELASDRVAMPKVNRETLAGFPLPRPPLPTQRAIADFLDRKTAAIDALIEKKERLLALLAEKRAALIHRAVTKGLDPDVPMKDSGVPWIGETPAHWDVARLGFVSTSLQTGPFGSQLGSGDYVDDGIPVINPANIKPPNLVADTQKTVDDDTAERLTRHRLRLGDLVLARRGALGRCGLVGLGEEGWICGTGSLRARLDLTKMNPKFAAVFISIDGVAWWLSDQSVGSTMNNLNTTILGRLPVVVPPLPEQEAIASSLAATLNTFDAGSDRVSLQIDRLQEYRQALITAAVTGQLDITAEDPDAVPDLGTDPADPNGAPA